MNRFSHTFSPAKLVYTYWCLLHWPNSYTCLFFKSDSRACSLSLISVNSSSFLLRYWFLVTNSTSLCDFFRTHSFTNKNVILKKTNTVNKRIHVFGVISRKHWCLSRTINNEVLFYRKKKEKHWNYYIGRKTFALNVL